MTPRSDAKIEELLAAALPPGASLPDRRVLARSLILEGWPATEVGWVLRHVYLLSMPEAVNLAKVEQANEAREIRVREIRASRLPLASVLDALILEDGAGPLDVIRVVMGAYGLRLSEAKGLVESRCHQLKNGTAIAASEAWIAARVAEIRSSGCTLEAAAEDFREGGSGHASWEPTGFTEWAQVLATAFDVSFAVASEAIARRRRR